MKTKKLIFVTQSKGGAGKSVLTFLLAEKYRDAIVIDMDDATKTTSLQLAYRKPLQITFLNNHNIIDRGLFSKFLEKISEAKSTLFICDLGASISEQLPFYLQEVGSFLPEILGQLGIEIEFFNVVGGANIYKQTMLFLSQLLDATAGLYPVRVLKNEFYDFLSEQEEQLNTYCEANQVQVMAFNIAQDKNVSTQNRIQEVLKSGTGIENAPIFSKMYFQNAMKKLDVAFFEN
jgi:hypothetical protein